MTKQVRLRRGTTAQCVAYTGPVGEIVIDTTLNIVRIQDGSTAGGLIVPRNGSNAMFADLAATGNCIFGDAAGDTVTFNGTAVSIPNGLNFDSDTLFIDSTNNRVGFGTNVPARNFVVYQAGSSFVQMTNATTGVGVADGGYLSQQLLDLLLVNQEASGNLVLGTANAEAARITSARYFKASNTGTYLNAAGPYHESRSDANNVVHYFSSTSTGASAVVCYAELPTGAAGDLYQGAEAGVAVRFKVLANGNVQNTNNIYGPLVSDPRLKENVDYNVNYLDDLMRLKVCKFSFKSENLSEPNQLGFLTSNIKEVFPKLIEKAGKAEDYGLPEGEPDLETYKASVLLPITIRALQEANNKIDALIARIEALEAK